MNEIKTNWRFFLSFLALSFFISCSGGGGGGAGGGQPPGGQPPPGGPQPAVAEGIAAKNWAASPVRLSEEGKDARDPKAVSDGEGNVFVIWTESFLSPQNNRRKRLMWSTYRPANANWSPPVQIIETSSDLALESSQLAIDPNGDLFIAYPSSKIALPNLNPNYAITLKKINSQFQNVAHKIWWASSDEPVRLSHLKTDGAGNAVVLWVRSLLNNQQIPSYEIQATYYQANSGTWSDIKESITTFTSIAPQDYPSHDFDLTPAGHGILSWAETDIQNFQTSIKAKHYNSQGANVGWSNEIQNLGQSPRGQIGYGLNIALPTQTEEAFLSFGLIDVNNGDTGSVLAGRYSPTSCQGWCPLETLNIQANQSADTPALAVDPKGNASVLWIEARDQNNKDLKSRRFSLLQNSWASEEKLNPENRPAFSGNAPFIKTDSFGNALALWKTNDPSQLHALRYLNVEGNQHWEDVNQPMILTDTVGHFSDQCVAINENSQTVIVFTKTEAQAGGVNFRGVWARFLE